MLVPYSLNLAMNYCNDKIVKHEELGMKLILLVLNICELSLLYFFIFLNHRYSSVCACVYLSG